MKKIVLLLSIVLGLPLMAQAQNNDDLYFIPSKEKEVKKEVEKRESVVVRQRTDDANTNITPGTTVIIQDRKGRTQNIQDMDVDAYNRRYDATDNNFVMEDDTLYITEKDYNDLRGEWVNGFEGSPDDYEYAERIIRYRNPRYAIHISSPYYWDVVYGLDSWNWNVYTDGFYAYAFPTFTNRLWWDWRWNSFGWGWGWNSWSYPRHYAGWYGGWGGYYGGYWGGYWGNHHNWGSGWNSNHRWNRPQYARNSTRYIRDGGFTRPGGSSTRSSAVRSSSRDNITRPGGQATRRTNTSGTRVVGTRPGSSERQTSTRTNTNPNSSGRVTYTRPSSQTGTSSSSYENSGSRQSSRRSEVGVPSRSSSSSSSRSYSPSTRPSSSRSSSSYSPGNSSSSRSSSSYSTGSSSRSSSSSSFSGGGGGSSRSSSGGGGGSSRSSGGGRR